MENNTESWEPRLQKLKWLYRGMKYQIVKGLTASLLKEQRSQIKAEIEGLKSFETRPTGCPDKKPGCLVYHQETVPSPNNAILDQAKNVPSLLDH